MRWCAVPFALAKIGVELHNHHPALRNRNSVSSPPSKTKGKNTKRLFRNVPTMTGPSVCLAMSFGEDAIATG